MNETITSANNGYIKNIVSLRLKKQRDRQQLFVVEGWKNISVLLNEKFVVEAVLVDQTAPLKREEQQLLEINTDPFRIIFVTPAIMAKVADTVSAQPLLAVVKYPQPQSEHLADKKFAVFLNNIQDPGNAGAIIRTAAAAGVEIIYCDSGCVDQFSTKVIRASAGAVFKLPIVAVSDAINLLSKLKEYGCTVLGTALTADAIPFWKLEAVARKVVVFGNEGAGIDAELLSLCDYVVTIPLTNGIESLNVSAAAAIVLFAVADK